MTCDSSAVHVKNALESVSGVISASAPYRTAGEARVRLKEGVDIENVLTAVKKPNIHNSNADFDLLVIETGGGTDCQ